MAAARAVGRGQITVAVAVTAARYRGLYRQISCMCDPSHRTSTSVATRTLPGTGRVAGHLSA
jgi:hypothetical protein